MPTGLERLESIFTTVRTEGRGALMPFVVGGHPKPGQTGELIRAIDRAGADAIEVGFPFSDPIADGPVVAAAMHEALGAGATPRGVLDEIAQTRASTEAALIAMVSVSIVERLGGPDRFVADASESGFDGFIFPDIAIEEAEPYRRACEARSVACSFLIAPSTPADRVGRIASACTGFIYLLARAGVTGERADAPDIAPRVETLRAGTRLPIAVGFGISTPEHVRAVVEHADAAIVGSALVRRISSEPGTPAEAAACFIGQLAPGCVRG